MGNILSAIADDIREYESLCRRFKEEVQMKDRCPDCYSTHAKSLKERTLQEDYPKITELRKKS